ncbi:MAG: CvpA family protein [Gammaproteobacteria bacterium]
MLIVDYVILGIIIVSMLISIIRGFVKEALSLVGLILAGFIAYFFSDGFADLFLTSITDPTVRGLIAAVILLILTLVVSGVVNFFAGQLVKRTGLSGTDRFIGVIFGLLRGVVFVIVMVLIAIQFVTIPKLNQIVWWQDSVMIQNFQALAIWFKDIF